MSVDDITEYLLQADGVRGKFDLTKIKDWITVAETMRKIDSWPVDIGLEK